MTARRPSIRSLGIAALMATALLAAPSGQARAQTAAPSFDGSLDTFNAWADGFNKQLVSWVISPVMDVYRSLPSPIPAMGRNAYQNLTEPVSALSKAMSSDAPGALTSTARFAINSTVGLLGVLDVANAVGLKPDRQYFAEGVCKANVPVGPYVVIPGVGDSTVGVAATAALAMAGSTVAVALISFELAMASVAVDAIATASALENVSRTDNAPLLVRKTGYAAWLASKGCLPS